MYLDQTAFTIVDVETTGLSPETGDRIIEIGALKLRNGSELGRYHSLVNPERALSPEAFAVNQISPEMVADAPSFKAIMNDVLGFFDGSILVAQNARFDLGFINCELIRVDRPRWNRPVLDTVAMARALVPGLVRYNLDRLARHFGVTFRERHRSMGDVEATAEIFMKMIDQLKQKGVSTLEDLQERMTSRVPF